MVLSLLTNMLGGGNSSSSTSSHAGHTSGTSSTSAMSAFPQYSFGSYGMMPATMPMLGGLGGSMNNLAGSYVSGIGMPSYTGFYSPSSMGMGMGTNMMGMNGMLGGYMPTSTMYMPTMGMPSMTGMAGMSGMGTYSMPTTTTTSSSSSGGGGGGGGLLGQILGIPLGLFSYAVGHDGALKAAQNGDIMGWLVNTQDHTSHSHALGGADDQGSTAPLAFLGTIGQEVGYLLGLDQLFGSAVEYDRANGTNYSGSGGDPTHLLPIWGGEGLYSSSNSGSSGGIGGLLGGLLNII